MPNSTLLGERLIFKTSLNTPPLPNRPPHKDRGAYACNWAGFYPARPGPAQA
jgi:hypothetical protein